MNNTFFVHLKEQCFSNISVKPSLRMMNLDTWFKFLLNTSLIALLCSIAMVKLSSRHVALTLLEMQLFVNVDN